MESILKVRITGIDYYTMKKVSFDKTIKCQEHFFTTTIPAMKINGGEFELPETIVTDKQHADEWFSNQKDMLNGYVYDPKHELNCILNWHILSVKNIGIENETKPSKSTSLMPIRKQKQTDTEKAEGILTLIQSSGINLSEDFKSNFIHVYLEMKDVLQGISREKQILIIMRSMNVAMMGASNAYKHILDTFDMFKEDKQKPINLLPSEEEARRFKKRRITPKA